LVYSTPTSGAYLWFKVLTDEESDFVLAPIWLATICKVSPIRLLCRRRCGTDGAPFDCPLRPLLRAMRRQLSRPIFLTAITQKPDYVGVPSVVFTIPPMVTVGISEVPMITRSYCFAIFSPDSSSPGSFQANTLPVRPVFFAAGVRLPDPQGFLLMPICLSLLL
jgi:hypothetical protein